MLLYNFEITWQFVEYLQKKKTADNSDTRLQVNGILKGGFSTLWEGEMKFASSCQILNYVGRCLALLLRCVKEKLRRLFCCLQDAAVVQGMLLGCFVERQQTLPLSNGGKELGWGLTQLCSLVLVVAYREDCKSQYLPSSISFITCFK